MVGYYFKKDDGGSWYPCHEKAFFFYLGRIQEQIKVVKRDAHLYSDIVDLVVKDKPARVTYSGDKFSVLLTITGEEEEK